MANETVSPNMNLPVPGVGLTDGPQYAIDLNACLGLIDSHNHASGQGVPINTDGLNINADLTIQSNNLTNVRSSRYSIQNSPLAVATDLGCVYVSGVDLYYNDVNGNQVRITQNGGVAGSSGSISNLVAPASASYVALSSKFVWQSAALTAADMDFGSAIMRNGTASSFALTLSPPTLSSNYTITLPALPASELPLVINSSGTTSARQLVNADISASANIARSKIANPGIVAKTTIYTVATTDTSVTCDATSAAFTVTLYTAVGNAGLQVVIQKTDSTFNAVTVAAAGGQTISGAASLTLNTFNESVTLVSNGTNWVKLARYIDSTQVDYTPTILGFGSYTGLSASWQRNGVNARIVVEFTSGIPTAVEAKIPLPVGLVCLGGAPHALGSFYSQTASAGAYSVLGSAGVAYLNIGIPPAPTVAGTGSAAAGNNQKCIMFADVPISGWAG